ncbi:P-loop NTPase fold protein [Flavobacterium sp. FlaQc-28]|uniref:P-loop NTPase fold protein n=1 Tax=Flavobacterium sp. FlaQc-28 TaxID=3374178 RepID=UPI003756AD35
MSNTSTPKFLKNNPIGEDLFEGKSQDKIADILSKVIKEEKFQIIGIDGTWGSGKSNLVAIINKKLTDHVFFIYDVWGHQEDDQRKSILVELTDFISSNENKLVCNKKKWRGKLKRLLSKEKEVTTTNTPHLSIGFILTLVMIIYVPTINTFAKSNKDFYGIENWIWKITIILFPVFLIFIIYILKVFNHILFKNNKWKSFKIAFQETFQIYNNKQVDETKTETISENEPSVKDFRNWMKEIDLDLGEKKLILVFDNFDRLPKKNILSIWSSIHIFFAEDQYKNIKVIIPFDRLHIKNAFSDLNGNSKNDFANDYINKTFDLVYRVSLPILSDWKTFFKARWVEAFTVIDENEYLRVEQIYETYRTTITPREMISCINEIVSIKLLDYSVPERFIALFVLNKDIIIEDPLKAITNPEFLRGLSYLYIDDPNFQKYITALAYQINPEIALEVAYKKQLKESLVNKNIEKFQEISKTDIFHKIIITALNEIENLENPIITLDSLTDDGKISGVEKQQVWNTIYLKIRYLTNDKSVVLEYQKIVIKNIDINEARKWVLSIISQLRTNENFSPFEYSKTIDDIESYFKTNNISIDVFEIIRNVTTKETEPDLFLKLVSEKKSDYKKYNVSVENSKLNETLKTLTTINLESVDYLQYLSQDYKLDKFIEELKDRIVADVHELQTVAILLQRLKQISSKPLPIELEDKDIHNLFTECQIKSDVYYDLIAMRLSKLNSFASTYDSVFNDVLDSNDDELVEQITSRIEYFINYDDFLIGSKNFTTSSLFKNVARKLITSNHEDSRLELHSLLMNFETICENIEIDSDIFLNHLDEFDFDHLEPSFIKDYPLCLMETVVKNNSNLGLKLLNLANQYLNSLNQQEWSIVFSNFKEYNYNLLKIIHFNKWNSFSSEALKETLINAIITKNLNKDIVEWQYLFSSFKKSNLSLKNTFKEIRDKLYNDSSLVTKDLFSLLLSEFIEYSTFSDKPGDSFRTFFKVEFLNDGTLIEKFIMHSQEIKKLMKNSSHDEVSDFKIGIQDRMENNDSIKNLANALDIKLPTKK